MGSAASTAAGLGAGFRILKIQPNSTAAHLKLEPFHEFIVSINNKNVSSQETFGPQLRAAEEESETVELGIYNAAKKSARRLVIPRNDVVGSIKLGATVRYAEFDKVHEEGLKILRVLEGTPAAKVGLVPNDEWIIATADGTSICHPTDLSRALRDSYKEGLPLGLIIYNGVKHSLREVYFTPVLNKAGVPSLGAELSHRQEDRIKFPTPTVSAVNTPLPSPLPSGILASQQTASERSSGNSTPKQSLNVAPPPSENSTPTSQQPSECVGLSVIS
eukprot:Blabericola_migrator_1__13360@NODE_947_length_5922_cov_60_770623_g657_i0_p5_GENE_NODE_947_length_5922_cov_60_770623_g657_i0NODE_947_length_5922_cov_60_770623_g657_i0_p5_ORF_typecomplete_len275_score57_98GRASP55_65/PF04495_14/1_3e10GRASP55_65/PF04495_14/8_2e16PDZ_2/PF13180_6/0_0028PDZ_2/PF13180_6/8_1e07PDZ_6/PF17820_1/1_4e02PDZ_6/PF17820_1/0_14PDZ_6/PF17820_1/0_0033PDZ/PF00595_24/4_8PDZ/PF00595_24/0_26Tricorn_PDZ/PF14685_6/0_21Tricorn_PDZ/PF14685_6/71Tricorn_PDZ/PF14685_6/1_1e04Rubredoxin_C/PF182